MYRLALAFALPGVVTAPTMYVPVELQEVPLARLSANLRQAMRSEPRNAQWVHNLARAHAMAWATRSMQLPVRTGYRYGYFQPNRDTSDASRMRAADSAARNATAVWFGYDPAAVPFTRVEAVTDGDRLRVARAHLDTALLLYTQAVAVDSTDLVIRLGQAWLLTQTDRGMAVTKLREVIRRYDALPDSSTRYQPRGGRTLLAEAARYLIPLLEPSQDRDEIATLERRIREEEQRPRAVTPIAVPLADSLSARDIEAGGAAVAFDADGTGLPKRWSWIRPNAAWLVHDPQRSGRVTSALQLFGSVTFWMFWGNGYEALASLDDDHDGVLRGRELDGLALWRDGNSNGLSERGEVRPLAHYDIIAVHCRATRDPDHPDRIYRAVVGVTYRDGTTRPTYDLLLHDRGSGPPVPSSRSTRFATRVRQP